MKKNYFGIEKLINRLLKDGYQIRFPGGTSKNGKKNSTGILYIIDFNSIIFFLVVPYELHVQKNENENEDFHQGINDNDPVVLLIQKIKEETGYNINYEDIRSPILIFSRPDNRPGFEKATHTKFFYLTNRFSGKPLDLSNSSLLNRETLSPVWVPAILLPRVIFIKHLDAFEMAIDTLFRELRINEEDYFLIKKEIFSRVGYEKMKKYKSKITRPR